MSKLIKETLKVLVPLNLFYPSQLNTFFQKRPNRNGNVNFRTEMKLLEIEDIYIRVYVLFHAATLLLSF